MLTVVLRLSSSSPSWSVQGCCSSSLAGETAHQRESSFTNYDASYLLRKGASSPGLLTHLKTGSYSWSRQIGGRVGTNWQAVIIIANMYPFIQQTFHGFLFVCTSVRQDSLSDKQKGLNLHGADNLLIIRSDLKITI